MKELDLLGYVGGRTMSATRSRSLCKRPGCTKRTNTGVFCPEHYRAIPERLRADWRKAYTSGDGEDRRQAYNRVIRYFKNRDRLGELINEAAGIG